MIDSTFLLPERGQAGSSYGVKVEGTCMLSARGSCQVVCLYGAVWVLVFFPYFHFHLIILAVLGL